jgi:hypothetical protein
MKLAYIGIVLSIVLFAVSSYFLFFAKEEAKIPGTTTTTLPAGIEKGKIFTPVEIKPGKNEIFIFSDKFEPFQLTISLGEEVKWINKDNKDHTIILSNPPLEKRVIAGDYFNFQFTSKGTVEFTDKETGVKGSITVS